MARGKRGQRRGGGGQLSTTLGPVSDPAERVAQLANAIRQARKQTTAERLAVITAGPVSAELGAAVGAATLHDLPAEDLVAAPVSLWNGDDLPKHGGPDFGAGVVYLVHGPEGCALEDALPVEYLAADAQSVQATTAAVAEIRARGLRAVVITVEPITPALAGALGAAILRDHRPKDLGAAPVSLWSRDDALANRRIIAAPGGVIVVHGQD